MKTYITLPFRYLLGRKMRTLLTTLAVVFGVAVVFAVNMMLPTMAATLSASETGVTGEVDMTVTSVTSNSFSPDALDQVAQTTGVAAVAPAFQRQVVLPAESNTPPFNLIGLEPARSETVRFYQVTDGRFLSDSDTRSAVVSRQLAAAMGIGVGDTFALPTPDGVVELSVVGLFQTQDDQVLVPLSTVQEMFAAPGQITAIDVIITAGADREAVRQELQSKLGSAFSVGSAVANTEFAQSLQLGLVVLNVFGVLALFMGAFLIFNTFRTVVVERRRDIGMLRAVGATRGTVTRLILVESALQGVIGTALGLALGYLIGTSLMSGLQGVLNQFMRLRLSEPVVPVEAVVLSVVLGIGVTVLAGLLPALAAGRVPVLAALREERTEVVRRRVSRGALAGAGFVVLGVVFLFLPNTGLILLGSVLVLAGLVMLAPLLLTPLARLLDPVIHWLFAREGLIAEGNVKRNPGRAAVTVSALMIALAIIVALSSSFLSIRQVFESNLRKSLGADILLLPPNVAVWRGNVGVGEEFGRQLGQIPGIATWSGMSFAPALVEGAGMQVFGIDPATYGQVSGLGFEQGDDSTYAELANGRNAIANKIFMTTLGYNVGDEVPVQTPNGEQRYRIVGVGTDYMGAKIVSLYVSKGNMAVDFGRADDIIVMANLAPGADEAAVKTAVEDLMKGYPQLTLYWGAEWVADQLAYLGQLFAAYYVIFIALMIPSVLGLINTLAINVLERTREIGVLRAIGATRGQIRRLVVAESLLLGMAGTALGLLVGLALGYGFTTLIGNLFSANAAYYFPFAGVVFAIALALIMALVASLLPARQAARVKIVQALQYE
ncbi:MAG TPA: FtsX-like permease family protein [Chloroflexia bacterium]|nr:FtsX-like permease family protein [Chloroflexia bacterium]